MNRRRFLGLLGSTALAPLLPKPAMAIGWDPGVGDATVLGEILVDELSSNNTYYYWITHVTQVWDHITDNGAQEEEER